jgi:transcription elongation factor SPT5
MDGDETDVERIARELEERHRMERRIVDRRRVGKYNMMDRPGGRPAARAGSGGARKRAEEDLEEEDVDMGRGEEDEVIAEGPSYNAVSQQSLVPSVTDPNLWMFSCPTGKEQELVYQIMNKCVAFAKRGRPLGITSVVVAQTKGKIYVESYSEPAVMEAVQGVRGLMQYTSVKVPIADMTTVMTVVPKKVPGMYEL